MKIVTQCAILLSSYTFGVFVLTSLASICFFLTKIVWTLDVGLQHGIAGSTFLTYEDIFSVFFDRVFLSNFTT